MSTKHIIGVIFAVGIIFLGAYWFVQYQWDGNTKYTVEDFEAIGVVYLEKDISLDKPLGKTWETAAVPIIFDQYGYFFNREEFATRYENYDGGKIDQTTYFTDLITYRTVTDDANAIEKNVITRESPEGHELFIYDPYSIGKNSGDTQDPQINIQKWGWTIAQ